MDSPGSYTPKGTALIELVRFYWRHPEQRTELADGRALERLEVLQLHSVMDRFRRPPSAQSP